MQIKPLSQIDLRHVKTGQPLTVTGVTLPGYRCLAEVKLENGHRAYADLPVGNHVYHPQLWDLETDEVLTNTNFLWTDIREEFRQVHDDPDHWTIIKKKTVRRAFVLNCLDFIYGHCLSRLLNYTLDQATRFPGIDCILLVPEQLAHLAPAECAEIWIYKGPLKNLRFRNLWLERAFAELYERMDALYLSPSPLHDPDQIDIRNHDLTRATIDAPAIAFSYREARCWGGNIYNQRARLEKLGELLSAIWPQEQLLLIGVAPKSAAWKWKYWNPVLASKPTLEDEQAFIRGFSSSLVTVGCQGSNMLLPCMLSWSTIRLLPLSRLSHFLGADYVGRPGAKQMETLYKSRVMYGGYELRDIAPESVFEVVKSIIEYRHFLEHRFIQSTISDEDIRSAAQTIPSEETVTADHFAKTASQATEWRTHGLRVVRKMRNRFEKIYGRIRWRG
jgi:hypothetical protein